MPFDMATSLSLPVRLAELEMSGMQLAEECAALAQRVAKLTERMDWRCESKSECVAVRELDSAQTHARGCCCPHATH
jgi:hypothetical protein